MFESDFGHPSNGPMPRVTPSRLGSAMLPFYCPSCNAAIDFSNPERREHFHDTRIIAGKQRNNHWCPACGNRFVLNMKGQTFDGKLDNGVAKSIVEQITIGEDGLVDLKRSVMGTTSIFGSFRDYVVGVDALC
jgi:hypothetical protein